jgi:energy-coupling factor transport system ATP-binding protein
LAQVAGWDELPLSVRDARRLAPELRDRLPARPAARPEAPTPGDGVASVRHLSARYGRLLALDGIVLDLFAGQVTALMGRNGSGKTTLLRHLVGLRAPVQGTVTVMGRPPAELRPRHAVRLVGLVPQDPASMLSADSVAQECAEADHDADLPSGSTRSALERLMPGLGDDVHPRDLSEGQRLALALAIVLAPAPPLILLDEPTRGLDYIAKARLTVMLRSLAADGHSVVLATHDVELVADSADRVVVLADGEIITDGPTREVVCHSPGLAPQVARILAPAQWLTVAEVAGALAP